MVLEETFTMQGSAPATWNLNKVIPQLASEIARLDPGPSAALRRGPLAGAGAAAFWKLTAEYAPNNAMRNEAEWAVLLQAIAILTPKGRDANKKSAHDWKLPMGRAIYNAKFSELRLASLLAAAGDLRRERAIRMCRRLATSEQTRFDLVTLARFILFGDDQTDHRIASEYYRADASARRESQN